MRVIRSAIEEHEKCIHGEMLEKDDSMLDSESEGDFEDKYCNASIFESF